MTCCWPMYRYFFPSGDSPSDAQNDTYTCDKTGNVTSITDTLATVGED